MEKIPLTKYAEKNGIDKNTARQRAAAGKYTTAEKIGRDWFIDPEEPHIDHRVKSGNYKDWRKKSVSNTHPGQ